MSKGKLYLIPNFLGESEINMILPVGITSIINSIEEFVVEEEKSARRLLKKAGINRPLQEIKLHLLNEHTDPKIVSSYLEIIGKGLNVGIISEAGCPAVADPGAEIVRIAHQKNIQVIPLVGPSSIILSLMASGLNGQNFCFHGYLPKEQGERIKKIKSIEKNARSFKQTQIFIEAPYRNDHLFDDIIKNCEWDTKLCIACNITSTDEYIKTFSIKDWKLNKPSIHKKATVFLLGI